MERSNRWRYSASAYVPRDQDIDRLLAAVVDPRDVAPDPQPRRDRGPARRGVESGAAGLPSTKGLSGRGKSWL